VVVEGTGVLQTLNNFPRCGKFISGGAMGENELETCGHFACERTDLYDEKHCIFHSHDIEGKKAGFNETFWAEFERQQNDEEEYDFSGFVFPGDISFEKKVIEKDISFYGAQFSGKTDFVAAQFSGEADFRYAQFSVKSENVKFWQVQFSGEARFMGAQFSCDADFVRSQFSGKTDFGNAQFSGKAYFGFAQFSGKTDFGKAQFSEMADFWYAKFSGEASFWKAQFSGEAKFVAAQFSGEAKFEGIHLEDPNKLIMTDTYFCDVRALFEYIEENKKKFNYPDKTEFLPENFKLKLGEGTLFNYPIIARKIQDDIYLLAFKDRYPRLYFLWWLFADCGRSIARWALWSMLFAVFFAFIFHNIFYLNDLESFNRANIHDTWAGLSLIYYSVVTFTTLGFGDITPKAGWLQFWVMLEVIIGYIMLGGLISILANKLARRS
jgi:uncharacterized protein YjbI with pentapeptide repeats